MKNWFRRPAGKYVVTLFTSLLLYGVALVVSLRWLHAESVLPALGIPLAVVRFCQAMDELELRIQLESLAFGFASTAIATFTYGFLQNAGLPQVSWVWVWPVMAVCWMVGQLAARWRYR